MAMDMNVALKITAGVTGQQAVEQLRTSMDKLQGAADKVGQGFGLAKTAVAGFLGLQAVQGVMSFARETINAADSLNDMAERTGMAIGTLSELEYAAKMNGRTLDDVQTALQRVAVKATDAATGNKAAAIAFDALGVSVRNADGSMRSSLEITEDIGDAFRGIQDPTLKAALAVELFGKQGPALIPLLENMQSAREEARDLGAVVGDDFAQQAAQFNDNVDRMTFMLKGLAASILSEVLPATDRMFNEFRAGIKVFGSFGSALWNVGTTNPFKTPLEQAKSYTEEVNRLEASIKKLEATGTAYDRMNAANLRAELETTKKLAEYFRLVSGYREAGGGRGFVNPEVVKGSLPDGKSVMDALAAANKQATASNNEAARSEQQRAAMLQGLNDEILKLTHGEEELFIAKMRRLGASEKEIAQAQELMRQRGDLQAIEKAREETLRVTAELEREAIRNKEELAAAGKRVFDETRTPLEKYNIEMERLNQLLREGAISMDTFDRAAAQAQEALKGVAEKGDDAFADLKAAIEGWGRQATDTFVDFAFTGKATFRDLVTSILQEMARLAVQRMVMAPLMSAFGGMLGGAFGGLQASFSGTSLGASGFGSGLAYGNMDLGLSFDGGGYTGNGARSGGIDGKGGFMAVLHPRETVIDHTKGQQAGGTTNSVVVNVSVENGGEQVKSNDGAGQLGRVIAAVVKNELIQQKRPGGLLAA